MPIPTPLFVGIDVSLLHLDLAVLNAAGQRLISHRVFANTLPGYWQIQTWLIELMHQHGSEQLHIAAEATSYYWLPAFYYLDQDPSLAAFHPQLHLLNARWVRWYKRSFPTDNKDDRTDPFYIADFIRARRPNHTWHYDPHWFPLRLLTRYHAHLTKSLVREKNLAQLYLFLAYTTYRPGQPFADPLAKTSRQFLRHPEWLQQWPLDDPQALAQTLHELSGHHLPHPLRNAQAFQDMLQQRYPLPDGLAPQVQFILEQSLELIEAYEQQLAQLNRHIQQVLQAGDYPEVAWLDSIPGLGAVLSAGLAAEIAGLERFERVPRWDRQHNAYQPRTTSQLVDAIAKIAGLWWPKNASGQFEAEELKMSKEGNAYLRYYLIEAADRMRQRIPRFQAFYRAKYTQTSKHKHKRALVLTSRKALGLFVALLRHQQTYRAEEVPAT